MHRKGAFGFPAIVVTLLFLGTCTPTNASSDNKDNNGLDLGRAILTTLEKQPVVDSIDADLALADAALQKSVGTFDWTLSASTFKGRTSELSTPTSLFNPINYDETVTSENNLSLQKVYRNGISIQPQITLSKIEQNEFYDPLGTSDIQIEVLLPLMKGGGEGAPGIQEESLGYELKAQQATRIYSISELVFQTVAAYWQALGAQLSQEIVEDSIQRGEYKAGLLRSLVEGGELAPSQLQRANAEIDLSELSVESRSERLYSNYVELARAMGISPDLRQTERSLTTPLLDPLSDNLNVTPTEKDMLSVLTDSRQDFEAARNLVEANRLLVEQADHNLLPQLDLTFKTGVQGASVMKSGLRPLDFTDHEHSRSDYLIGLSLEMPIDNSDAKGDLARYKALYWQSQSKLKELEVNAHARLKTVLNTITRSRDRFRKAQKTVKIYDRLTQEKLDEVIRGEAQFGAVVELEDRLTSARLNLTEAQTSFAVAVAELRLITGTSAIVDADRSSLKFTPEMFMSFPRVAAMNAGAE